jgi:hypothetical protein
MGTAFRKRLRAEATAVALSFVPLDTNFEASWMNMRLGYLGYRFREHNRHKPPKESGMASLLGIPLPTSDLPRDTEVLRYRS